VKANRVFHLIVTRSGHGPAFMADRHRTDRVEVVSIDDGEVVLFWELAPREATKLIKALRADLVGLEAEEFVAIWEDADVTSDWPS
jgi:hypothetical protein